MKEGKFIHLANDLFFLGRDINDRQMGSVVLKLVGYIENNGFKVLIFAGDSGIEIYMCQPNNICEDKDIKLEPIAAEIENRVCTEIVKLLNKAETKWRNN